MPRGEIPTPEEVVPLLQNQSGLVHQLETENAYLKVSINYHDHTLYCQQLKDNRCLSILMNK